MLYRAHYHSMECQMELTRHGIPFSITSGLRFFEQAHVKDVAAFLKFVCNPRDEVAFKRMVRLLPGIGARSAEGLWEKVACLAHRCGPTLSAHRSPHYRCRPRLRKLGGSWLIPSKRLRRPENRIRLAK